MTLKLTSFRIHGFKSLVPVEMTMPKDCLILIGRNGSGKSSILQALAFVQYFVQARSNQFAEDRLWKGMDIKPLFGKSEAHRLKYELVLQDGDATHIEWRFEWDMDKEVLIAESINIHHKSHNRDIQYKIDYEFSRKTLEFETSFPPDDGSIDVGLFLFQGSLIFGLRADNLIFKKIRPFLRNIQQWGVGVLSLELLNPTSMRRSDRGKHHDIGIRGDHLPSFLASLDTKQKSRVVDRVKRFYNLSQLETAKAKAGWVDLRIAEQFASNPYIPAVHMSDGFMRILALCAIPEFKDPVSLILLDEIEDGIEPHILADLVQTIVKESPHAQFIMTSHSPLLINMFDNSHMAFCCRAGNGATLTAPLTALKVFTEDEYVGPGELWAHLNLETIEKEIRSRHETPSPAGEDRT